MKNNFQLGSKWVYIKIYGGPKILEKVLIKNIYQYLERSSGVQKFFFIRYEDELGYHLRVRVLLKENKMVAKILSFFNEILEGYIDNNFIYNVSYDTYKREIERYGSSTIKYCESIFHLDSLIICEFLNFMQENGNEDNKKLFLFCMNYIDDILSSFNYSLQEKINFSENYKEYYEKEFLTGKRERILIDKKFRTYKSEMMLKSEFQNFPFYNTKIKAYQKHAQKIASYSKSNELEVSPTYLVNSLIHMTCNRLFRIKQRQYEYVIYSLIGKKYKSIKARRKYDKQK